MALIITLIILGIILLLVEILLIPGFAVTGIFGLLSLAGSCYFAFTQYGTVGGTITIAANVILIVLFLAYALRSKTWKKLTLHTNIESKADQNPEEKGIEVGQTGVTMTRLNPMGKARINNIVLEVKSADGFIDNNLPVKVTSIEDNQVVVKGVES